MRATKQRRPNTRLSTSLPKTSPTHASSLRSTLSSILSCLQVTTPPEESFMAVPGPMDGTSLKTWLKHHQSRKQSEARRIKATAIAQCNSPWSWTFPSKKNQSSTTQSEALNPTLCKWLLMAGKVQTYLRNASTTAWWWVGSLQRHNHQMLNFLTRATNLPKKS